MAGGVSVVIPLYGQDRLRLLAATLASMRQCTGVDQIIVSEAGALPCGLDVAREYGADYVFTCRPGPFDKCQAVNAGFVLARADTVLRSDGDFLMDPDFIARAHWEMRASGADFFYPHNQVIYLGESDTAEVLAGRRRAVDCGPISVSLARLEKPGGMEMVRTEFLRRHGGMIEGFRGWGCEDDAWLRKAELLGRVEVSRDPAQRIWHLFHRDSGSHSHAAHVAAIRRNRHHRANALLVGRINAIGSAEEFTLRYPPPAHAAPPWPATRLAFVTASSDSAAAALARGWARRIGDLYGAEPAVVVADRAGPRLAADAIVGFADDVASCRALTSSPGEMSVLVTNAVEPGPGSPAGPLILAGTAAQVSEWRSRGLPVWHRPWQESEDPEGLAAPPLVQPLSHLLGSPRTWRIRIGLERAALPDTALDRPRFWYIGLHDAEGIEMMRRDLDAAELRQALAHDPEHIVIERSVTGPRPPVQWTIWPTDRRGRWLDRLSGPVGPECLS